MCHRHGGLTRALLAEWAEEERHALDAAEGIVVALAVVLAVGMGVILWVVR